MKSRMIQSMMFGALCLLAIGMASAQPYTLSPDPYGSCYSRCENEINVKGIDGSVKVHNLTGPTLTGVSFTVQLQSCPGVCTNQAGTWTNIPLALATISNATVLPTIVSSNPNSYPFTISFNTIGFTPNPSLFTYRMLASASGANILSNNGPNLIDLTCQDQICVFEVGCTLTQGFWKNHASAWPVLNLTLGSTSYDQAELLAILNRPVKGNGLISLAHQLIAAKLNVANGGTCASAAASIAAADALIGSLVVPPKGSGSLSTSVTSTLVSQLDSFNNGLTPGCPGHCAE